MAMELRHLRYFVAVVEEGSLTTAAERRLHTSQPSLSRQIRDLEHQVGAELLSRSVHGIELTAAGKAFLDHARLALMQVDAAVEAARRAAQPVKKTFAIAFQTGHEMNWLPKAMHVLRDELKSIEVKVSSDYSPDLAEALARGRRGQYGDGDVPGRINPRAGSHACLCQEPAAVVCRQPSAERRDTDDRGNSGLQQVEHLSDSQIVPVTPRRTGGAEPEALTPTSGVSDTAPDCPMPSIFLECRLRAEWRPTDQSETRNARQSSCCHSDQ